MTKKFKFGLMVKKSDLRYEDYIDNNGAWILTIVIVGASVILSWLGIYFGIL